MAAYFGDPGMQTGGGIGGLIPTMDYLRDKAFEDYKNRKLFDADLAIKQDRARSMFDPQKMQQEGSQQTQPQNVVFKQDMTPYEKAQLGLEARKVGVSESEAGTRAKLGEERIGIQEEKNKLEQAKSDQIHQTKMDDMQRKIDAAQQQMDVANKRLQQHADDAQAHQNLLDATLKFNEAKHAADLAQRGKEADDRIRDANRRADIAEERLRQNAAPTRRTTEYTGPEGTSKSTVTTQKDMSGDVIHVKQRDKDGKVIQEGTMPRSQWNDSYKDKGWSREDAQGNK